MKYFIIPAILCALLVAVTGQAAAVFGLSAVPSRASDELAQSFVAPPDSARMKPATTGTDPVTHKVR